MKIFVGGATGATGQEVVRHGRDRTELVVHVRPKSTTTYLRQQPEGPQPAVFDVSDADAVSAAMQGCHAVISCIGTMAKRYRSGDTYARSDIGANQSLIAAAVSAEVSHFILMGSLGTQRGPGPYFAAKRAIEATLRDSGLAWTVLRPSALVGNGRAPRALGVLNGMGRLPGLGTVVGDLGAIGVDVCARAMVQIALDESHRCKVVFGSEIRRLGDRKGVSGAPGCSVAWRG